MEKSVIWPNVVCSVNRVHYGFKRISVMIEKYWGVENNST